MTTVFYRALIACECGQTRAPKQDTSKARLREQVEAWLINGGFARRDYELGGALRCKVCRTMVELIISEA